MKKIITKENFKLNKVKVLKSNSGLSIDYSTEEQQGGLTYFDKDHKESTKEPHPDLLKKFSELKPILCRIYYFTFIREVINRKEFAATDKQLQVAERAVQEILPLIEITGVSISGEDEGKGVIIMGTFKAPTNQKMAINSHRLKWDKIVYGFEEELQTIIEELESECFEYLFNDKKAQLTIEFEQ